MYAGKAIHFSGNHAGHLAGAQVPMVNGPCGLLADVHPDVAERDIFQAVALASDRKSTRLNSSHSGESRMPSSA